MDIATKQSSVEYRVHLGIPDMERQYNVTPEGAVKTLNELYKNMTDYEDLRYMDMDFLVSNNKKALTSMSDFINKINEHNSWKYFSDNKMVECYSEFGYDDINLESVFSEFLNNIRDLILYLEDNGD